MEFRPAGLSMHTVGGLAGGAGGDRRVAKSALSIQSLFAMLRRVALLVLPVRRVGGGRARSSPVRACPCCGGLFVIGYVTVLKGMDFVSSRIHRCGFSLHQSPPVHNCDVASSFAHRSELLVCIRCGYCKRWLYGLAE